MKVEPTKHACHRCGAILSPLDKLASVVCPICCDRQHPLQPSLGTGTATRTAILLRGGPPVIVRFTQTSHRSPDARCSDLWRFDIVDDRIETGRYFNDAFAGHYAEEAAWTWVAKHIGPIRQWEE